MAENQNQDSCPRQTTTNMSQNNSNSNNNNNNNDNIIRPTGQRPSSNESNQHQLASTATFSIATPTVTTILPMTENINDTSFMLSTTPYSQDGIVVENKSLIASSQTNNRSLNSESGQQAESSQQSVTLKKEPQFEQSGQQTSLDNNQFQQDQRQEHTMNPEQSEHSIIVDQSGEQHSADQEDASKVCKKRNKVTKKSAKLDAKSKLEKSRQSARECRARKKLRYQYLEDLVCNREKAVIKLREELTMFCEMSKQIDVGTISDADRRLLVDQTKENSRSESTSLL